jgi:CNT family concentrative nucleoside transporter
VVSALSALLFHWRILPLIVRALAWGLERALGVGGAVGLSAAANIFVGMTEAPILIRPYLKVLRRGELFMVMACGMATIAGTVMVIYATILAGVIPNVIGHILTASIISAPAAIVVAHLMVPDVTLVAPGAGRPVVPRSEAKSAMDAVARGATDGMRLLIAVIALLVVLVALVHLVNQALGLLPDLGAAPITLQRLFGYLFAPIAWLMGVPWAEAVQAGALIGTKTVLNEFIAYMDLAALPPEALSARTRLILTYALCGFANFGSLGILIAGLATMAPERRAEIAGLGMKAIVAGTLATCMTGAVIGML